MRERTGGGADRERGARAGIIGRCPALLRILDEIDRVAPTRLPVIVLGETGTGKERIARYVHERSPRAEKPFVIVNCGALPKELVESVLFGHERGAFTGAIASQKGKFEVADGGTIFLDEIGELPCDQQVKLLRVLQEGVVERVGGSPRRVDVRVLAATNRDLQAMMAAGTFRADLYYRVCGLEVTLPPLRDRGRDIIRLAKQLLEHAIESHKLPRRYFSRDAEQLLARYPWPGNIREFERVVETTAVLSQRERITASDLAPRLRPTATTTEDSSYAAVAHRILALEGHLTNAGFRAAIHKSAAQTRRILRRLVDDGILVAARRKRWRYYVAA